MSRDKIIFISGNPNKAKYLAKYFHLPVDHVKLNLSEIQSLDLEEIVRDKAQRAYEIVKQPVLVEDTSLTFLALKKLPGPLIKWFLETLGNKGLCNLLNGYEDRRAVAEVCYGFVDDTGVQLFSAQQEGMIALEPRGEEKFGWDPIFIPHGCTKTRGEMDEQELQSTSMRPIALTKLKEYLDKK